MRRPLSQKRVREIAAGKWFDVWETVALAEEVDRHRDHADRIARHLVEMLCLYPCYRVDSRGPAGCIMEALAMVAPKIATEIREHGDAGATYVKHWGDE